MLVNMEASPEDYINMQRVMLEKLGLRNISVINAPKISGVAGSGTTKSIFLTAKTSNNSAAMIKVGIRGSPSYKEVKDNYDGYLVLKSLGIAPMFFSYHEGGGNNFIIMEMGKKSFIELARSTKDPEALYRKFARRVIEAYKITVTSNKKQSDTFMLETLSIMKVNLEYMIRGEIINSDFMKTFKTLRRVISSYAPEKVLWSNWLELSPEHVYINGKRFIIIDPKGKNHFLGIPEVELGMFATLCNKVYGLPKGPYAYLLFRSVSRNVSKLQGISGSDEKKPWLLGEALQYTYSSRFRIQSDPERARLYGSIAAAKINQLVNLCL